MNYKARIDSVYNGSAVDGKGLRCVVFFTGCNMRCGFCHNPETWTEKGNEIELSFEVPLMAPASDPLSQFFAIANDLCCRIDAVMTDASGNPIGSRAASRIESALKGMHNTMAEHGVPAGSRRACLIFSAD